LKKKEASQVISQGADGPALVDIVP
jgi:hypothetical protein